MFFERFNLKVTKRIIFLVANIRKHKINFYNSMKDFWIDDKVEEFEQFLFKEKKKTISKIDSNIKS